MRKQTDILCFLQKAAAICLTAAVCITSLPATGMHTVKAAAAADRKDPSIVYFVDCGDYVVDTVSEGDQLGTHNSVTDQVYGEDPVTGYKWGIVDTISNPLKNGECKNGGVSTDNTWPYESNPANKDVAKTASNRYTKNQFESGIEERYLDYKFEVENGKYEVTICCTDPWGCSKSPNAYLNYGKDTQVTLKEGVEASAQKPAKKVVDVTDGELTVNLRGRTDANKAINLCYILITSYSEPTEEEIRKKVSKDYAALDLGSSEIKTDIELPTAGTNDTTITWKSSNEAALSSTGRVTRPAAGKADIPVTLTATISYQGQFSMTKEFKVKVMAASDMESLEEFAYGDVNITDDYYNNVAAKDVEFLNKFDPDRLMYNFRLTAGYTKAEIKAKDVHNNGSGAENPYPGGWENSRIGGHTMGHYLAAAAQAVANGYGDVAGEDGLTLNQRLDYMIDELKDCQDKLGTGFIFGATMADVKDPERQFNLLEQGTTSDTWVPWYTMHKIVNGLVETYRLAGNETALEVAENIGEWIYNRTLKWDANVQKRVLNVEYGGMNDCLYELYKCVKARGDYASVDHFKEAAHKFDETELFDRVLAGEPNVLNGRHANCTIPKFMGALNRYRALKDEGDESRYLQYAESFWTLITEKHTYITGGNSECEFFGADNVLDLERSHCNCETCNTHNMLKLTRELYRITGDKKYADYYENTFINAIMASVNEETGMTTYFQPMATGYFKVYCNPDLERNYFWCCTGTGLENFTKLGDSFYYYTGDKLIVNQYTSSEVTWKDKGVTLKQETSIPNTDKASFTVQLLNGKTSAAFDLRLRVPDWAVSAPTVKVNGTAQNAAVSNGYVSLNRTWKSNDKVEITLPMGIKAYTLPDNAGTTYGFKYGPIVLAAELGVDDRRDTYQIGVQCDVCKIKIVNGQERVTTAGYGSTSNQGTLSSENLNVLAEDTVAEYMANIEKHLVKDANSLSFTLTGTDWGGEQDLKFTPYYRITDQRYGIYWLFQELDPQVIQQQILGSKEAGRDANVNLSGVGIGYGSQTEGNADTYPCMAEEGTGSTGSMANLTRYANAGGSFSYLFKVDKSKKNYISCQYSKADNGKTMVIKVGDTVIATDTLDYKGDQDIYIVKYEIPAEVVATASPYELKDDTTGQVEVRDVLRISFSGKEGEESPSLWKNASTMTEYSHNAGIKKLTSNVGTVSKTNTGYQLTVPKGTQQVEIKTELQDKYGLLYVNGALTDDTRAKRITLGSGDTIVNLQVFAEDHETKADYKLVIKFISVSGIKITPTAKSMSVGESVKLNCTVTAANAADKAVSWKSSNTAVATVDQNGKVTAKKQGTAIITATSKINSSLKATCKITVKKPSLAITGTADLAKGKSLKLKAKLTNLKGSVKWTINSKKFATIKSNGTTATLKAKKKVGKVKVTAQVGSIKKTVTIQVVNPVKSIKLNAKSKSIKAKKSYKLKATVLPKNATNKKVTYKSSNTKVATVSSSGKIKAKKKGKATITVTSKSNPKVKTKCKIVVK